MVIGEGVRQAFEDILVPAGMGDVKIFTEMGRYMLAPYGALVAKAIHVKHTYKEYIGLDACAANLMRPAMYGSYHHITVMGKEDAPCDHKYDITGGLCENNDKFAIDRSCRKSISAICSLFMMREHMVLPWATIIMVNCAGGSAAEGGRQYGIDSPCGDSGRLLCYF